VEELWTVKTIWKSIDPPFKKPFFGFSNLCELN
jgi:hypothetical protein